MKCILNLVRLHYVQLSALILAAITILSLWPLATLPKVPGGDKIHHYIAYAALMLPVGLRRPNHWPWIVLFFFGWSGCIELIQPYVHRYGEWGDLAANGAGLMTGLIIALLFVRLYRFDDCN